MAAIRRQLNCTFPKEKIRDPVLYLLGRQFNVIPNIRRAQITDEIGIVLLELEGEQSEVDKAIEYLRASHIGVEVLTAG
ncbi:MAG: FeS-binding protein [Planctomycetes bacterium]|nr:FeS-binding protein [Planctomycetota bacterium]